MELVLENPQVLNGRIVAQVVAAEYGYRLEVSCHADLLTQWPGELVQKHLVAEAAKLAPQKVAERQAELEAPDAQLEQFAAELAQEIPGRVRAYYEALLKHYADDPARVAVYTAERDAWEAAQVDPSVLAGAL